MFKVYKYIVRKWKYWNEWVKCGLFWMDGYSYMCYFKLFYVYIGLKYCNVMCKL